MINTLPKSRLEHLSVKQLQFDPHNPRFYRGDEDDFPDAKEVVELMLEGESVIDLVYSIGQQGFFDAEPLIVVEKDKDNGKAYIVVEGNRRLAALKNLNKSVALKSDVEHIVNTLQHYPETVPCVVYENYSDVLHFLGYRHVTGVRKWGPLQKAFYIERLMVSWQEKDPALKLPENYIELVRKIAKDIGSSTPAIKRSLSALAFFKKGNEHQPYFFGIDGIEKSDIQFGSLYTALSYTNIAQYVGLEAGDLSLEHLNIENAKRLIVWMFERKTRDITPLISDTRQLKQLDAILGNKDARNRLEEKRSLDDAIWFTVTNLMAIETLLEQTKQIQERIYLISTEPDFRPNNSFITQARAISVGFNDFVTIWKNRQHDKSESEQD